MCLALPDSEKWETTGEKQGKTMNLIGGKQAGREDEVSWGIVSIYLKAEMKKCRVNSC